MLALVNSEVLSCLVGLVGIGEKGNSMFVFREARNTLCEYVDV